MNVLLKNLTAAAVLATTAVLLVADSSLDCPETAQDVTFDISNNTCGRSGTLRVSTAADSCSLTVEVASGTGLPEFGELDSSKDLREGGWYLHDASRTFHVGADGGVVAPDAGSGTQVTGNRHCSASREGDVLRLSCIDRYADLSGREVGGGCEAVLTPR